MEMRDMNAASLRRLSRSLAVGAAVLLILILVLITVDWARGRPLPWPFGMLLVGLSLGISGALLRRPEWQIPLSIASLIATLVALSPLIGRG
jgi:hypothetical protein